MEKKSAEQQLKDIATKSGTTMREIYQLVDQVYREEANYQKRISEMKQNQVNSKQLALMDIELHNRAMEEMMLESKLQRHLKRLKRSEKIKSFFTFKKKVNGHSEGTK